MNVVIKFFNGREVIPVRALPFLSDRKTMSPDVVAKVFAGKNELVVDDNYRDRLTTTMLAG